MRWPGERAGDTICRPQRTSATWATTNTTAAVLAGADHDQQTWGRPKRKMHSAALRGCHCTPSSKAGLRTVPIGEAVGSTQFRVGSAATPRQAHFAEANIPPV